MPRDCPHDRCDFFVQNGASQCPACGGSLDPAANWFAGSHGLTTALVAVVALAIIIVLWQLRTSWLAAAGVAASVATIGGLVALRRARPPNIITLDDRYGQAVRDAEYWLEKWGVLFAQNAGSRELFDDERLALLEAQAGAADAAAEACTRRDEYANRYVTNGFDRLAWLETQLTPSSAQVRASVARAVALVDQYLERLWMDPGVAEDGRRRLQFFESQVLPAQRRREIIDLVDGVRLFEAAEIPANEGPLDEHRPDAAYGVEAHLHRLRAERALLDEARRLGL